MQDDEIDVIADQEQKQQGQQNDMHRVDPRQCQRTDLRASFYEQDELLADKWHALKIRQGDAQSIKAAFVPAEDVAQ